MATKLHPFLTHYFYKNVSSRILLVQRLNSLSNQRFVKKMQKGVQKDVITVFILFCFFNLKHCPSWTVSIIIKSYLYNQNIWICFVKSKQKYIWTKTMINFGIRAGGRGQGGGSWTRVCHFIYITSFITQTSKGYGSWNNEKEL